MMVGQPTSNVRRVLHLRTVTGKGGGPEKTLLTTPKFLGDDYQVRLAYIRPRHDPEYDMPQRAREMGVSLVDLPERGAVDPSTLWALAREVRRFRPHLLLAHDYKTNILGILLARWFRLPIISMMHGYVTISNRLNLYYRLDRWALRRMDHVIAVSPDLHELAERMRVPADRLSLVENAIDTDRFRRGETRETAKQRLGMAPDRLLIGGVGRLQPEKGFEQLLRVGASLIERGHEVDVVIVGDGPLRGELESLARQLGHPEHLRLLGHRSDMIDLYHALDLFVLSSLREGLPNVVLEAMAMEVPVIATRVAGVPRLIEDEVNGRLVECGDEQALLAACDSLVASSAKRDALATEARRTIESRYSFTRRMERIREIYDRVFEARPVG